MPVKVCVSQRLALSRKEENLQDSVQICTYLRSGSVCSLKFDLLSAPCEKGTNPGSLHPCRCQLVVLRWLPPLRGSQQGLAGGKQGQKPTRNRVSELCLLPLREQVKSTEKALTWAGSPRANPLCPPTSFSAPLTHEHESQHHQTTAGLLIYVNIRPLLDEFWGVL